MARRATDIQAADGQIERALNGFRIKAEGSSDTVTATIAKIDDLIRRGRLVAGQRLIERDLVQELGVGRSSVREALRILAGDGVIELVPNRGARVRNLAKQDIIGILQVLDGVICVGNRLFVESKPGPKVLAEVVNAMERIRKTALSRDYFDLLSRLSEFHSLINSFSGNSYLNHVMTRMHIDHYHRVLATTVRVQNWKQYVDNYQRITDALLKGDAKEANKATALHVGQLIDTLRKEGDSFF